MLAVVSAAQVFFMGLTAYLARENEALRDERDALEREVRVLRVACSGKDLTRYGAEK